MVVSACQPIFQNSLYEIEWMYINISMTYKFYSLKMIDKSDLMIAIMNYSANLLLKFRFFRISFVSLQALL